MDAIPASASGNGFDAALKALEDLETTVVQTRDDNSVTDAPAVIATVGAIGFSDPEAAARPGSGAAMPVIAPDASAVGRSSAAIALDPSPAEATTEGAAAIAPLPVVPAAGTGRLGKIAVGMGLAASALSAVGLLVAERTIMSAQLVVADARERQRQLAQANELIDDLRLVRDKQIELLRAQQAQVAVTPVSSEELQRKMDALQAGLVARDPLNNVVTAIRESQLETNARLNEFGMKMARFEAATGGH